MHQSGPDAALGELQATVNTIESDYLKAADKTALQGQINALDGLVGDTAVATQISNAVADEAELREAADTAINNKIGTVEDGTTVVQMISDAEESAVDRVLGYLAEEEVNTSYDTLKEVAAWIESDTTASAELVTRVTTAEGEIDALQEDAHTHANKALLDTYTQTEADLADAVAKKHAHANAGVLDGITAAKVAAWDAAEQNAKDYVDAEVKELAEGAVADNAAAIEALQTHVGMEKSVATQITEAIEALKIGDYAKAADLTAAINQHNTDKTALEGAIALKANDADLAAIAKTGSTDDLVQGTMTLVFNCGGAE